MIKTNIPIMPSYIEPPASLRSSYGLGQEIPTKFTMFRKLPKEVRDMIWDLAYEDQEPRVIEVKSTRSSQDNGGCIPWSIQATHPPTILHINHESRDYFLKTRECYTSPFFEQVYLSQCCQNMSIKHLLFDPKKDILFLNLGQRLTTTAVANNKYLREILNLLFGDSQKEVAESIRKFAAPITAWKRWFGWLPTREREIQQAKLFFPNLELALQDNLDMIGRLEDSLKARLVRFQKGPPADSFGGQVAFYNVEEVERGLPRWEWGDFEIRLP